MQVLNDLLGYKNLKIYQDPEMFSFSLDSVLLPNFITIPKNTKEILDIGTGNAPIPVILSTKTNASITAVEIQEKSAELAQKTIEHNNLQNQIKIINQNIKDYADSLPINNYDIITCNPPYFKVEEESKLNKNDYKTIARHEVELNLEDLCNISKKLLKNNGIIGIVHRPERLLEILCTMKKYNLEPKKIQFVYPKENTNANTVLIEGRLNGKEGIKIMPPIIAHDKNGEYTKEVQKYFE